MLRTVIQAGASVLRTPARELSREEIQSGHIQDLIRDLTDTKRGIPACVAIAAPQVGEPVRLIVLEDTRECQVKWSDSELQQRGWRETPYQVLINPRIVEKEEPLETFFEGCLSIPKILTPVPRYSVVYVDAQNAQGEHMSRIRAEHWYARILQHEIDHIEGKLYVDHIHESDGVQAFVRAWLENAHPQFEDVISAADGTAWVLGSEALERLMHDFVMAVSPAIPAAGESNNSESLRGAAQTFLKTNARSLYERKKPSRA